MPFFLKWRERINTRSNCFYHHTFNQALCHCHITLLNQTRSSQRYPFHMNIISTFNSRLEARNHQTKYLPATPTLHPPQKAGSASKPLLLLRWLIVMLIYPYWWIGLRSLHQPNGKKTSIKIIETLDYLPEALQKKGLCKLGNLRRSEWVLSFCGNSEEIEAPVDKWRTGLFTSSSSCRVLFRNLSALAGNWRSVDLLSNEVWSQSDQCIPFFFIPRETRVLTYLGVLSVIACPA